MKKIAGTSGDKQPGAVQLLRGTATGQKHQRRVGCFPEAKAHPFMMHKRLENSLKKLTRFGPNDRGHCPQYEQDGLLEQIENRITELGQHIEDGKRVADSVEEVRNNWFMQKNITVKSSRKGKNPAGWSNWRLLQNEYFNAARDAIN